MRCRGGSFQALGWQVQGTGRIIWGGVAVGIGLLSFATILFIFSLKPFLLFATRLLPLLQASLRLLTAILLRLLPLLHGVTLEPHQPFTLSEVHPHPRPRSSSQLTVSSVFHTLTIHCLLTPH